MNKKELRKLILERRRNLDRNVMEVCSDYVYNNLIGITEIKESESILCYISTDIEINTRKFISYLFSTGKKVYAPRCSSGLMNFYRIYSLDDLRTGAYNIPEPTGNEAFEKDEKSVCIVPALLFDMNGYRLGYGGGYYDRFLADYNGVSVGISINEFIGEVPVNEFDMPVDILVTDDKVLYLNKRINDSAGKD